MEEKSKIIISYHKFFNIIPKLINYVQGDLRKLSNMVNLYKNKPEIFTNQIIENIFGHWMIL